ncbi:hypothetical protein AXF42_Ash014128 [Apostasia shenzhenica]|uniref:Uncharacterized protein n=1 Tax=Apostasia shenzhenica TaxID=1088818 RepID=A0A2I0A124_9ASPA|nr:hypothetical protein AXF42_Ash014128 [Apostasia shenzhenica]
MNVKMKDITDDRSTMIFIHSILSGEFYNSFVDMWKTLMEARFRAEKCIHLKDAKALKVDAQFLAQDKENQHNEAKTKYPQEKFL